MPRLVSRSAEFIYDRIASNVLLPMRNRLKRDYRYRYAAEIDKFNESPPKTIAAHQINRLRKIVFEANENSEFFRERVAKAGIRDIASMSFEEFANIETITKEDFRVHRDAMLCRKMAQNDMKEVMSGGTTAAPVPVFLDSDSVNRRESATFVFNNWFGFRPGHKIAYLWGAVQDNPKLANWKAKFQNRFVDRRLFLPSAPLDDGIMESYWRRLQNFHPRLLQGFPSSLAEFSEFLLRTERTLDVPAISTTAEAMHANQRSLIRKAFGTDPYEWYGVREAGRVATECRFHMGMHINCYGLYLEVEEDPDFASDKTGDIVITDLWNTGMPIIRYRIGDVGRIDAGTCRCGSNLPRLTGVLGRSPDVFVNSKGQRVPMIVLEHMHGGSDEIRQLQFIQYGIGSFEVKIVPGENFENPDSTERVIRRFCDYLKEDVDLKATIVDDIPREPSGKLRLCKNEMKFEQV